MSVNKQRGLRIGLTGGIASGKTLVATFFGDLGVCVIDTDQIARDVVTPGEPALQELVNLFGAEILQSDGALDRRALRTRVFSDATQREKLEAVLHPRIRAQTLREADAATGRYHIIAVPLLLETEFHALVDRILVVDCTLARQRERLLARDGEDPQQADRILATQASRETRLTAADDVIDNNGSRDETRAQVERLHARYLNLAAALTDV